MSFRRRFGDIVPMLTALLIYNKKKITTLLSREEIDVQKYYLAIFCCDNEHLNKKLEAYGSTLTL